MTKKGVYRIVHLPSKRIYIGSSNNIDRRLSAHYNELIGNRHDNSYLQNVWNKSKLLEWSFEQLEVCKEPDLLVREQYYLDFFNTFDRSYGFNLLPKAGRTVGVIRSPEWRAKISAAKRGKKGFPHTEEFKLALSLRMKGNKLFVGRSHSLETRHKMSVSHSQSDRD